MALLWKATMLRPKRIVNKKLLKSYQGVPCVSCGNGSNACHIESRGAGGDDVEDNLIAMCFICHRYQHDHGWSKLIEKHPHLEKILEFKGWVLVQEFGVNKLRKR